ncbi:Eco57I restriction-modification methylase domain-containing protein [Dermabacteraceae bacterium TAE3-ERU5]|nr:Eco57I restriction-modification methylase domain-containing protein [Dermabacteraceae bacterium TAE3-ERU5]
MTDTRDFSVLDQHIIGRVTPHIYAFTTGTVPDYLKVGDTYRTVERRLGEWRKVYPDLQEQCRYSAAISENVYFRDHSVHSYLIEDLGRERLTEDKISSGTYCSREFFRAATAEDVESAIHSIRESYDLHSERYTFYDASTTLPQQNHYVRSDQTWDLRPNQEDAVNSFIEAVNAGRTNLLLYAVMRFGKSYTSLECAKSINAKTVVVVSAKADVESEWRKTTEVPANFSSFYFLNRSSLDNDAKAIQKVHDNGATAVVFLTLQDLKGDQIKGRHKQIFSEEVDLLIIDESHYGARAEEYGKVLRTVGLPEETKAQQASELTDVIDPDKAGEAVKAFKAKVRLHLSGTPYRILMGSEFAPEDIIGFVQFTDIVRAQEAWDDIHVNRDGFNEWDNPYFGFPQMVRFAFNLNESARARLKELGKQGASAPLSTLLQPRSVKKDTKSRRHTQFIYEEEVLDLLRIMDGTQYDDNILGFLDYDKIKDGNMCRHIVMVLPYKASCDAMEQLLNSHTEEFKNLGNYQVINIAGLEAQKKHRTPESIKQAIEAAEKAGQKTITLTVNKMLTGSTVEQWDTMLFLKETSSPQEYDQAIFRLQNQYVRELQPKEHPITQHEATIKQCLKPQTILVDFDPTRMFRLQEQRALFANVNTNERGNDRLEESLSEELRISPIITMNADKIHEVQPTDILQAVSNYNASRSINDEVMDVPVDLNMLKNELLRKVINRQAEIGSKGSLELPPNEGQEDDLELGDSEEDQANATGASEDGSSETNKPNNNSKKPDEQISLELKIRTYYQRIFFFAMLAQTEVCSLGDIISSAHEAEHPRILKNLGLEVADLKVLKDTIDPFKLNQLDYKIQNINHLGRDESLPPIDRALRAIGKFSRISGSEVRTPNSLCNQVINQLPKDQLKSCIERGDKVLDVASKSGEFALAIFALLVNELGIAHKVAANSIYSIPTSKIAYEFTRHFYNILGLNPRNIARNFSIYDLLQFADEDGINSERLNGVIRQPIDFDRIDIAKSVQEGEQVKFAVVVGNPPYQKQGGSGGSNDAPIYQEFVNIAEHLQPILISMIIKAQWFSGGRENLIGSFRKKMLSNRSLRKLYDFPNSKTIFPDAEIKGGICYFLIDQNYDGDCETHLVLDSEEFTAPRDLRKYPVYIRHPYALSIIEKVQTKSSAFVDSIISSDTPFGIPTNPKTSKKTLVSVSDTADSDHEIALYYNDKNARKVGYVSSRDVKKNIADVARPKVIFPKTGWSGNDSKVLGIPMLIEGQSVCSQTYLYAPFDTIQECTNFVRYYKTRFFRFLVSTLKITQDAMKRVYRYVPMQDFGSDSLCASANSVNSLDDLLFEHYELSNEEIDFIKQTIDEF